MRFFNNLNHFMPKELLFAKSYLTNIVFPLFPTVMPEFLKPESIATECCKKINWLNSDNLANQIHWLALKIIETYITPNL